MRAGSGREPVGVFGAVEANQGVEVHDAAELVLGDLGVLHRRALAQPRAPGTPSVFATSRRRAMVNRRHRSGAHHCHTTWEA